MLIVDGDKILSISCLQSTTSLYLILLNSRNLDGCSLNPIRPLLPIGVSIGLEAGVSSTIQDNSNSFLGLLTSSS